MANDEEIPTEEDITEKAAILEKRLELQSNLESFIACVNASIENGLFKTLGKKQEGWVRSFLSRIKETILRRPSPSTSTTTPNAKSENTTSSQNSSSLQTAETKEGEEALERILKNIEDARDGLKLTQNKTYNLSKCERALSEARRNYANALYSVGRGWTFENEYAGYVWILLAGLLVSVFALYYFGDTIKLDQKLHVDVAAINAVAWGVIGATLRAIWFLKEKVDERGFRKSWNVYFISVPFLGGILGGVVYLIISAGIVILGPSSNIPPTTTTNTTTTTPGPVSTANATAAPIPTKGATPGSNATAAPTISTTIAKTTGTNKTNFPINAIAIIPFSALAGYNWEWAIGVFNQIAERFPIKTTPTKDISKSIKK